jgi:AraC family transcriptional regulator
MSVRAGSNELEVVEGELTFTNVGEFHSGRSNGAEFVSISVSPALVEALVADLGLSRTGSEVVFRTAMTRDDAIIETARLIAGEVAGEGLGHRVMLDALVRQLVVQLLRSHLSVRKSARIEMSRAGPVDRRLRRAIEFMHDNYSRELAVEEIAAAAYLSEYHFARLFKQITGVTPHLYLANLRLESARKLLVKTQFSISEIAAMVGYQSQSHFTKIFKSVTGMTPRAYRAAGCNDGTME